MLSGAATSVLALVGSVALVVPERTFKTLVLPTVSLATGSLLGGSPFHMLPESVEEIGNRLALYGSVAGGILSFFVLEQYLHWHHPHQPLAAHRPLGLLILVADGLHNLIGGLAVGSAFEIDTRLTAAGAPPATAAMAVAGWVRSSPMAASTSATPTSPTTLRSSVTGRVRCRRGREG